MNYGNKKNEFSCLKNVWHLRRKQRVIIADHPNVRAANLLMMDVIKRNWPSQRSKRYPLGYIEFQSWKKFDYATQTIGKRPAYIFCCTHEIESYYRIKTAEQIIGDSIYNK